MKKYWYRVRITARRIGGKVRVQEMVADVEAVAPLEAIKLARKTKQAEIDLCYVKSGRTYMAERLGTTEELVNNA